MPDDPKPTGFSEGGAEYRAPGGEGWGGEATRGTWKSFEKGHKPDPAAQAAGKARKAAMREKLEEARGKVADRLIQLLDHAETDATKLAAANAILDRLDGKPVQAVSGPEGEALPSTIAVRFVKPE